MEQGFISIIEKMTAERGVQVWLNGEWRKWLKDYMKNQYTKETALFKQILEAKCADYIESADNVLERKQKLLERLEDDHGLSPKKSAEYLDLLGMLLKGDRSKCWVQSAPVSAGPPPPAPVEWLISRNGKDEGPFDRDALLTMAHNRKFTADTPVWKKGMTGWAEAGTVTELAAVLAEAPPPLPPPKPSAPPQSVPFNRPTIQPSPPLKPTAPLQRQTVGTVMAQPLSNGFVKIPGGTFMMGSPVNEAGRRKDEGPQHQVTVRGFWTLPQQVDTVKRG